MGNNVVWHKGYVDKNERNKLNKHNSGVVWFTGLSSSGKSTIAHYLEKELHLRGIRSYVFDGDNVRHGLNSDLGFSHKDRNENIRRIVEVARLFVDSGIIVLAAFITPFREERKFIRSRFEGIDYIETYVKCDIGECINRDPKGLYKKAQAGIIKNYTGISSPYEEPEDPDLTIDTQTLTVSDSVVLVLELMERFGFLGKEQKV